MVHFVNTYDFDSYLHWYAEAALEGFGVIYYVRLDSVACGVWFLKTRHINFGICSRDHSRFQSERISLVQNWIINMAINAPNIPLKILLSKLSDMGEQLKGVFEPLSYIWVVLITLLRRHAYINWWLWFQLIYSMIAYVCLVVITIVLWKIIFHK